MSQAPLATMLSFALKLNVFNDANEFFETG